MKRTDIKIGDKFGYWTVIGKVSYKTVGRGKAPCKCVCGVKRLVDIANLNNGTSKSCSCIQHKELSIRNITHGQSKTKLYKAWQAMLARCYRPTHSAYKNYGARGIKVCKRWMDFSNFLADMGQRPPGMTVERINNNGDYKPSNCRWATYFEQARNRRGTNKLTLNGVSKFSREWEDELGLSPGQIGLRLTSGWPLDIALSTPKLGIGIRLDRSYWK